jgi:Tfp pilus assembly protein PilF
MRALGALILLSLAVAPAIAQPPSKEHVDAMRHLHLGQENLHAEAWDKAEIEFQAAIKLEPTMELAHYGLGQVYMNTRRFPAAVAAFLACRDAYNTNIALRATNDLGAQRALEDQIQALEDERNMLAAGRVKSALSGTPADLDRRINDLKNRRFHDKDGVPPVPPWIEVALGSAYFRGGSMADAEREYRAAIAADPKLGEAHSNLAVVYLMTGRATEADAEITLAEKSGFKVNPQLKSDVKKALPRP